MFLITGAGRSGTKYMAQVLQRCGLDVYHERLGNDGIVSSFYCFDAADYPGKHLAPRPQFDLVLHQVREPLATIASMQTGQSWEWACQFLPVNESAPLLARCAYNWLIFNEAAEKQAIMTYRVEDLEHVWQNLQRILGLNVDYDKVKDIPKNVNARKHSDVTWDEIRQAVPEAYDAIRVAAKRYGYG